MGANSAWRTQGDAIGPKHFKNLYARKPSRHNADGTNSIVTSHYLPLHKRCWSSTSLTVSFQFPHAESSVAIICRWPAHWLRADMLALIRRLSQGQLIQPLISSSKHGYLAHYLCYNSLIHNTHVRCYLWHSSWLPVVSWLWTWMLTHCNFNWSCIIWQVHF